MTKYFIHVSNADNPNKYRVEVQETTLYKKLESFKDVKPENLNNLISDLKEKYEGAHVLSYKY